MAELSIVIATLDRHQLLGRVLDRLDLQAGPFEVVVAADAAERDIDGVRAVAAGRPYDVRVVQADVPGVSAARNRGWPEARHPAVVFLGDDMLPRRGFIERHRLHHMRHPEREAALLGHVRWARELRTTALMRWLDAGMQFDFRTIDGTEADFWHFYAANASLKKPLLEEVGGYDEAFRFGYEELDLAVRLDRAGMRLTYDRRAEVEHLHPPTISGWRRRMATVAHAERQFVAKYPEMNPYFLPLFERAVAQPPSRGRGARLIARVPRGFPILGPRAWRSADVWFAQQLAPAFLQAWYDGAEDE